MYKGGPGRTGELAGPGPVGTPVAIWTVRTEGPIKSSPAVVGGTAYLVTGDSRVTALDLATGRTLWATPDTGFVGSVTVSDRMIYVAGLDQSLSALAIADGKRVWQVAGAVLRDHSPLLVGGLVIAGGADTSLHAYDAASGDVRWSAATGGDLTRGASAADGRVFVGSNDGFVYAFDRADGHRLWAHRTPATGFATTTVRNGAVYASGTTSDATGILYALDAATGEERWTFKEPGGLGLRSATVDGDGIYVGTVGGPVYGLGLDGSVRWTNQNPGETEASISVVGDTLYFFGTDDTAVALDRSTGHVLWQIPLGMGGGVAAGTTVADGIMLAGTDGGAVVAIGAPALAVGSPGPSEGPSGAPSRAPRSPLVPVGELTGAPGGLLVPVDATVAPDGSIWVAEGERDDFAIFGADGTFVERWGGSGSGDGQFDCAVQGSGDPTCSLVFGPSGDFYVGDSGNFRIQHFDRSRKHLANIGRFGSGDGQFLGQTSLALGGDARLYAADSERQVQLFDEHGKYVMTVGDLDGAARIREPAGLAVHGSSLFVTVGDTYRELLEFRTDGTFVRSGLRGRLGNATDLALGPDGNLYVADWDSNFSIVDPKTFAVAAVGQVGPGWPDSTVQGLDVLDDGRVVVAEWKFGKVELFRRP
jgi:outer membrane protein assembly factor BamB